MCHVRTIFLLVSLLTDLNCLSRLHHHSVTVCLTARCLGESSFGVFILKTKRTPMKTCVHSKTKPTLARSVAGEDLQIGEFISVLSVISEMPSFMWDSCDLSLRPEELIRLEYMEHTPEVVGPNPTSANRH